MKTRKRSVTLFLIVLLAFGFCSYYYLMEVKEVKITTEKLITALQKENITEAERLTEKPSETRETLLFLMDSEITSLSKSSKTKLTGITSATSTLELNIGQEKIPLTINLGKDSKGWRILGFSSLKVYPQAIILSAETESSKNISILHAGETFKLSLEQKTSPINFTKDEVYFLATYQNKIFYQRALEKKSLSKIVAIDVGKLEGEKEGFILLNQNYHIYHEKEKESDYIQGEKLIVGQDDLTIYLDKGLTRLVKIKKEFKPKNIRVALNTKGYKGLYHEQIVLSSPKGLKLVDKINNESYPFSAGEQIHLISEKGSIVLCSTTGKKYRFNNRIHILPLGAEGISLNNIQRGYNLDFTPLYRGHLEVTSQDDGLIIINDLPLEQYLYSVIPSEMPLSFGLEALKAQAIAARTYAMAEMYRSNFENLGANLDDSTNSQVYNNIREDSLSNQAVNSTKGLILTFEGKVIDAKFFSTSSGYTAASHEVWSNPETMTLPGKALPYLIAKSQLPGQPDFEFVTSEQFRTFITSPNQLAYDRDSPFFRWNFTMNGKQLQAAIEANLAERYKADPKNVLTKTDKGTWESMDIPESPLGALKGLYVLTRGKGGNIMTLEIRGAENSYLIKKEFNIRSIFKPVNYLTSEEDVFLERMDGSILTNYALLPSTFLVMDVFSDTKTGEIKKVSFYGGGNGHGVGMSQWGVKGMIERRHSLEEVFAHYYPGASLVNAYKEE